MFYFKEIAEFVLNQLIDVSAGQLSVSASLSVKFTLKITPLQENCMLHSKGTSV